MFKLLTRTNGPLPCASVRGWSLRKEVLPTGSPCGPRQQPWHQGIDTRQDAADRAAVLDQLHFLSPQGPGRRDLTRGALSAPRPSARAGLAGHRAPLQARGPVPPSSKPLHGTLSLQFLRQGTRVTAALLHGDTLTASSLKSGTSRDAHQARPTECLTRKASQVHRASKRDKGVRDGDGERKLSFPRMM